MIRRSTVLITALFVFLWVLPFVTFSQVTQHVKTVKGNVFAEIIKREGMQIIDVRTASEYEKGNIPGAVNINVSDGSFLDSIKSLDKSKPVAVYCGSGGRSRKAVVILSKNGFSEIYELKGGISRWKGPVEK